jgi:hypothetical protein
MADRTAEVPADQRFAFRVGINIGASLSKRVTR